MLIFRHKKHFFLSEQAVNFNNNLDRIVCSETQNCTNFFFSFMKQLLTGR